MTFAEIAARLPQQHVHLSERERSVLAWTFMFIVPMFFQFGLVGALAVASVTSWMLPGFLSQVECVRSGSVKKDARRIFMRTVYAFPIFLYWAMSGHYLLALTIVPLAAGLTACYIIAWYGPVSEYINEENRRRLVAFFWACFFALLL